MAASLFIKFQVKDVPEHFVDVELFVFCQIYFELKWPLLKGVPCGGISEICILRLK